LFKEENRLQNINIYIPTNDKKLIETIQNQHKICSIINYSREIGQLPGNVINPVTLATICQELGKKHPIKVKVLDENDLDAIGAHAILSVGKGSISKPRMIILEYSPKKASSEKPIVLVGKAITFDTGGYSIKPVDGIKSMKFDKLGGITVLGTILAAASLKINKKIVGIICAAENMISEDAYRPDDIIKTLSGKTVEILSTDAEGRLVLADGITYAQRNYQPACIVDFATLTGGIVIALGKIRAGLFSNNQSLSDQLFNSGEVTSEKLWKMPLDDEYFEFIKGDDADLKNAGGKEGHPIMGAIFLKQFIENDIPWAHIDIAGSATSLKSEHYLPKGAKGFGIRLMIDFLTNQ
jgi:leucyl aminopeptidase